MPVALPLLAVLLQAQPGVAPASDVARLFARIAAQAQRLDPILQQIKPNEWAAADAPANATALWQSAVKDNRALIAQARTAAATPDRLSDSLRLLQQIYLAEEEIGALLPSVSKYQNPALAELIGGVQSEGKPARDAYALRVMDLATEKEEQLSVEDHEAQRCRALLSREPRSKR